MIRRENLQPVNNQEETGKDEKCQGQMQDRDEKMVLNPDKSTIMYSSIRPTV
jgi:hypothetical protein